MIDESSGNEVCCIDRFSVDGKVGRPYGIASHGNEVYIAVMELNEKTGKAFADTGHIYQYSIDGKYQRCIIKGINRPWGITTSNDKLYGQFRTKVTHYLTSR